MRPAARRVVVDASVALKWFLPEPHSECALRLRRGYRLVCPDLLFTEVANGLWRCVRRDQLTQDEASQMLRALVRANWRVAPSRPLVKPALDLAVQTGRTVYDCLYLALAVREKTVMVTADERLCNALADGPLADHVLWIEGLPDTPASDA